MARNLLHRFQCLLIGSMTIFLIGMAQGENHAKCRNSAYRGKTRNFTRFQVPDAKFSWDVSWSDYCPPYFTDPKILNESWADPEMSSPNFHPRWNELDGKVNRKSHEGTYSIVDYYPRNPRGRTGIRGRGILGRWGPNHAADPIVTRWKRNENGIQMMNQSSHKPILQVICILRGDTKEWALPGGMVDPGEQVTQTLKREFSEEALDGTDLSADEMEKNKNMVNEFLSNGDLIYKGYIDDCRNTDNAWMESVASNFHDETGESVGKFALNAGDDATAVQWKDVDCSLSLYASHSSLIKNVADKLEAHWCNKQLSYTEEYTIIV